MALTPQFVTGGAPLMTDGGAIAGSCCCGTTGTSCLNGCPEMLVTVFDADYAGGDLNWAGQTWTQAEVQSGVQKTACPTGCAKSFESQSYPPLSNFSDLASVARHYWQATGLSIFRRNLLNIADNWTCTTNNTCYTITPSLFTAKAVNKVSVKGVQDYGRFSRFGGSPYMGPNAPYYTFSLQNGLSMMVKASCVSLCGGVAGTQTVAPAKIRGPNPQGTKGARTFSLNYVIPATTGSPFFGSTTIGGVLYTWTYGAGW